MIATLGTDLGLACDPVAFARACGIAEPYAWQARALRSTAPRALWNCCRQSSKSTTAALIALHAMAFVPETLAVVVAQNLRTASELRRKAADFYRRLGHPDPPVGDSALSLELPNRSRLIALPGTESSARGWSAPRLVIVDEASRVPVETIESVIPTQAVVADARLLVLSTPNGMLDERGEPNWFAHEWHEGEGWERESVTADEIPTIRRDWLERERQRLGPARFRAEFYGDFTAGADGAALDPALLRAALTDDVAPLVFTLPAGVPA